MNKMKKISIFIFVGMLVCSNLFAHVLRGGPWSAVSRSGPSSSVSASPFPLNGLQLWLDADDANTITIATGVSQWNDKSGNGRNVTQGTAANQPALVTDGQNSRDIITFDGTNDFLNGGDVLDFERTDTFTFFLVYKSTAINPTTTQSMFGKLNHASPFEGYVFDVGGTIAGDPFRTYLLKSFTAPNYIEVRFPKDNDTNWHVIEWTYTGSSAASGLSLVTDGSNETPTVASDTLSATTVTAFNFTLGTRNNTTTNPFGGSFGELLCWNRDLTNSESNRTKNYLKTKWNTT